MSLINALRNSKGISKISNTQQNELTGGQSYFNVVKMEVFKFYEPD